MTEERTTYSTGAAKIVEMLLTIDECCLIQRLRQLRKEVLQKQEIRVIIDVTTRDSIKWWVADKNEKATRRGE